MCLTTLRLCATHAEGLRTLAPCLPGLIGLAAVCTEAVNLSFASVAQCMQVADCRAALLSVLDAAVKLMDQADQRGSGQASTCDTRVAFAHAVSARHAPCFMHACMKRGYPVILGACAAVMSAFSASACFFDQPTAPPAYFLAYIVACMRLQPVCWQPSGAEATEDITAF